MRKLFMGNMPNIPQEIQSLFNEIIQASQDADVTDIGGAYTITGTFIETRTLNVTTPTTANIAAVLATLIFDLQRGGATRST